MLQVREVADGLFMHATKGCLGFMPSHGTSASSGQLTFSAPHLARLLKHNADCHLTTMLSRPQGRLSAGSPARHDEATESFGTRRWSHAAYFSLRCFSVHTQSLRLPSSFVRCVRMH